MLPRICSARSPFDDSSLSQSEVIPRKTTTTTLVYFKIHYNRLTIRHRNIHFLPHHLTMSLPITHRITPLLTLPSDILPINIPPTSRSPLIRMQPPNLHFPNVHIQPRRQAFKALFSLETVRLNSCRLTTAPRASSEPSNMPYAEKTGLSRSISTTPRFPAPFFPKKSATKGN
ncbi:hypothetical protein CC80DRAFT_181904 [Byssothecium circinans]|uniref:Uncharacterized protein n=1 Tax=Byssothecium circinans TaxID=147558 RepID=A0A6A5TN10_9PLEO|nr:hypothetical protein CC80DRAFT_181904 [Byssothecium circinans]